MLGGTKRNVVNYVAASLGSHTQSEESGSKSIAAPAAPVARTTEGIYAPAKLKVNDPNMTDGRLLINRRCIYERRLPGDAYVTAHAERLQHGYFSSENTSDPEIPHVDFLAVNFVMHPGNTGKHRFKSATIKATIQNAPLGPSTENPYPYPQENPKFLMHAPHLIYGAVSPETLQWTFSLAGSLGVSEIPVSASVNPSGMRSASYKVYDMMKIQGSCRTFRSSDGPEFDVEDGEIVWSLSENGLQRSGLPREFSFVMLIAKPHPDSKLSFKLDIDPVIDAWYGSYPLWWINRPSYKPMHKRGVNFRVEFGQRFTPVTSERGFNFATLAHSLDDYVNMPGTTYSSNISSDGVYNDPNGATVSNPPFQPRPLGGTRSGSNSRPVYVPGNSQHPEYFDNPGRPEFHYSQPQPLYYPQFSTNGGETWQNNSPFRRGWPSGQPYHAGLDGSRNNPENTINVRVVLDTAATSHIAAATLATPMRKPSPLLKAPGNKDSSSTSDTLSPQRDSTIRTRSLRRTKSRDFLNRLPTRPRSMVETDPAEHHSYDQRQPDNLEPDDAANEFVTNGLEASPVLDSSTMYEINDTPPPNSIRDPSVINGRDSDTPSKPSYQTVPINGTQQQTPLTNGVQSTTPPSSGIRRMRNGVSTGYIRRRSASYAQNGYSHNNNRYSYPTAPAEDDLTMF